MVASKRYKHKGLQSVYQRGFLARLNGGKPDLNPYRDDGRTFSTAFHNAWRKGWWEAHERIKSKEPQP